MAAKPSERKPKLTILCYGPGDIEILDENGKYLRAAKNAKEQLLNLEAKPSITANDTIALVSNNPIYPYINGKRFV